MCKNLLVIDPFRFFLTSEFFSLCLKFPIIFCLFRGVFKMFALSHQMTPFIISPSSGGGGGFQYKHPEFSVISFSCTGSCFFYVQYIPHDFFFRRHREYIRHIVSAHRTGPYVCRFKKRCVQKFRDRGKLMDHVKAAHFTPAGKFRSYRT